jgi:hypothetical protein
MFGVPRLVNISSEQAPGFFSNNGPPGGAVCHPKYCPVDEEHPMTPNNPYSLSKSFGEQICDAAVRRTAGSTNLAVISIRPSWWTLSAPTALPFISSYKTEKSVCRRCQDERNIERNLGPLIRDHSIPQEGLWSCLYSVPVSLSRRLCAHLPLCRSVALSVFSRFVSVSHRRSPGQVH